MATEYQVIDIWVGHFPSGWAFTRYFAEAYSDDNEQPISQFATDMGQHFYDHDFLEHSYDGERPSADIRSRLEPHSFSQSYADAAANAFELSSLKAFNTVLLAWGRQIVQPISIHHDDYWLQYLGRFACDPEP